MYRNAVEQEPEVLTAEQENVNLRDTVRSLEERRREARGKIADLELKIRQLKAQLTTARRGARLVS